MDNNLNLINELGDLITQISFKSTILFLESDTNKKILIKNDIDNLISKCKDLITSINNSYAYLGDTKSNLKIKINDVTIAKLDISKDIFDNKLKVKILPYDDEYKLSDYEQKYPGYE